MAGSGRNKSVKRSNPRRWVLSNSSPLKFDSPPTNLRAGGRIPDRSSGKSFLNPIINEFKYNYPASPHQDNTSSDFCIEGCNRPTMFGDLVSTIHVGSSETPIVSFVDQTASKEPIYEDIAYNYGSNLVLGDSDHNGAGLCEVDDTSHKGLGFCDEIEETSSGLGSSSMKIEDHKLVKDTNLDTGDVLGNIVCPERNPGFLSIGGMKLYTEDISDDGSAGDNVEGAELSGSDFSEYQYGSSSISDDELAEDYLKGIGGIDEMLDTKWLVDTVLDVDEDKLGSIDEAAEKLGGIALQKASIEYGMKKPQSRRKLYGTCKFRDSRDGLTPSVGDLMLLKDPIRSSAKKKYATRTPQSWPPHSCKSKAFGSFPGAKKKHHKEMIAWKRRERMKVHGVDLEEINSSLKKMVLNEEDMLSFQPMHSRDCSQVRRLAAIYRLRSGCEGSGRKRFVTVSRTAQTCMPSPRDEPRLEMLLGPANDSLVSGDPKTRQMKQRSKVGSSSKVRSLTRPKSATRTQRAGPRHGASLFEKPVSFVSSGIMGPEISGDSKNDTPKVGPFDASKVGSFEAHTRGFGSKMMAKMGFEGGGLGKDGQGMSVAIDVIKRPKLIGLGLEISEDKMGDFERHKKGFGSKMVGKMGFRAGMWMGKGLGRVSDPLVTVWKPILHGSGARS